MMTRILWLFNLFFILICLFFIPKPVNAHVIQGTTVIHLEDNKFNPDTVYINQGDTVIFENTGKNDHWPASNIHPTHGIYPEFDPKKPISPGKSWEFKFEKSGFFRFHDHLYPELIGEIIVKGQQAVKKENLVDLAKKWFSDKKETVLFAFQKTYYSAFPQKIESDLSRETVLALAERDSNRLKMFVHLVGSKKLLERLLEETRNGNLVDCHQPAHVLGRLTYEVYQTKAFEVVDHSCHSGYTHGAMESFLSEKGTDNLTEKISLICDTLDTSFSRFECLHGVGHGVLAYQDYNLPQALSVCQGLDDGFKQSSCFGGVFMENILTAEGKGAGGRGGIHKTSWVSDDPYFPCNKVDQDPSIQRQCYLMQTSRMLDLNQHDFKKVSLLCASAPENYRTTCFQSYGRDAAGQVLRDPTKIVKLCNEVPTEYFQICINGGINVIIDFWGNNLTNQPQAVCLKLMGQDKRDCYSQLGVRLMGIYGQDKPKIVTVCNFSEENFKDICKKAAGV